MAGIKQVVTVPQLKTLLTALKSKFAMSVNGNKPDANGKVTLPTFTGASASAGGTSGLVPAPATGKQSTVLKGDGTWGDLSVFTGATTALDGKEGLVPQPTKGNATRYLRSDGAWSDISTMTGASTTTAGTSGLVPTPNAGSSNRYLSADGTWTGLPKATADVLGGIKVGDGLSVLDGLLSATASAANTGGIVAANLADNGYVKFANGLIVQWGRKTMSGRNKNFAYPITFNTLWYVNVLGYSNVETFITSASTSSVTFNLCNGYRDDYQDGSYDCYMFAVGK